MGSQREIQKSFLQGEDNLSISSKKISSIVNKGISNLPNWNGRDKVFHQEQKKSILSSKGSQIWLRKRYKERGNLSYLWRSWKLVQSKDLSDLFLAVQERCPQECKQEGTIQSEQLYQLIKENSTLDKKAFSEVLCLIDRENTGKLKKDQFETLLLSKTIQRFFQSPDSNASYSLRNQSPPLQPLPPQYDSQRYLKGNDLPKLDFSRVIGQVKYQTDREKLVKHVLDTTMDVSSKFNHLNSLLNQKHFTVDHIGVSPLQQIIIPKIKTTTLTSANIPIIHRGGRSISQHEFKNQDILEHNQFNPLTQRDQGNLHTDAENLEQETDSIDTFLNSLEQEINMNKMLSKKKHQSEANEPYLTEIADLIGKAKENGKLLAQQSSVKMIKNESENSIQIYKSSRKLITPLKKRHEKSQSSSVLNSCSINSSANKIQPEIDEKIKKPSRISPLKKCTTPFKLKSACNVKVLQQDSIKLAWQDNMSGILKRNRYINPIPSQQQKVRNYKVDGHHHFLTEIQ